MGIELFVSEFVVPEKLASGGMKIKNATVDPRSIDLSRIDLRHGSILRSAPVRRGGEDAATPAAGTAAVRLQRGRLTPMTDLAEEIRRRVLEINDHWRSGRYAELDAYFHPDIILVHPRFEQRTVGRQALISSYADFGAKAHVEEFTLGEVQVDVLGGSVVSITPWRMQYEYETVLYDESGWDVLIFNQHDDAWVAVWRTVLLDTTPNAVQ